MLPFGSSLSSSLVNTSIQPVCCTSSRNLAAKGGKSFIECTKYENVLVKALSNEAFKALGRANLSDLTQGFRMAADHLSETQTTENGRSGHLKKLLKFKFWLFKEIGELIAEAFEKGWENDLIIVFVLDNPLVLIHEMKISNLNVFQQSISPWMPRGRPLLVVIGDIESEVVGHLMTDSVCVRNSRRAIMEDLAFLTGVITGGLVMNSTYLVPLKHGSCKKVIATMDNTVFIGGSGDLVDIQERCEQLRSTIEFSSSDNSLKDRLPKLSGGFAVLKVYGHGKPDVREKRLGIINALYAVKAAKEEGILPCIPYSFRFFLNSSCYADRSMHLIYCIPVSFQHLQMPAYVIATNARVDGSVVDKLLEMLSYLSEAGKFTDTFMCVVVDPLKLVRSEFASAGKQLVRPLKFTMISLKKYNLVHGG
ncbi:Chaperonin [Citrus sinensis]|uniref:Chaperonin n=2 Tax=Citrus sinensis TaxID=2711 RepID=A0ACB8L990_CITSI|nr:Chaperonin [Citrus sinensis]